MQILILNLMPLKEETELQLLRSLSNTPLQVDVSFMMVAVMCPKYSHQPFKQIYQTFDKAKDINLTV